MRFKPCTAALRPCTLAFTAILALHAGAAAAETARPMQAEKKSPGRIVTLEPLTIEEASSRSMVELTKTLRHPLENFREFEAVSKGQIGDTQTLTLRFAAAAKLLKIEATPDAKVEQGGSCVQGYSYAAKSTCTLLVRSTPQGPGHRLGKVTIVDSAEAAPLFVGIGGFGYSPTISFTPSIITTVPGTDVNGAGIVSGGSNITVDGGDTLYIADTGNNKVESIDSSGTIVNVTANAAFGSGAPISVVVDRSGYLYFTRRTQYYFLNIITSPSGATAYPTGSTNCAVGSTCNLGGANLYYQQLGSLTLDPNGTIFLNTYGGAARFVQGNGTGSYQYIPLVTPYNYNDANSSAPLPLAVDSSDTLYTYYNGGSYGKCVITGESYYNAANSIYNQVAVAGTNTCGYSGDGGQARGAQIGTSVGQMAFDTAGNLYFSDTSNQRVRRIDGATGIITTIAGNGTAGYSGDNGPATSATLRNPTGVAVDSQGQVYILSTTPSTGTAQVVRKVGVVGALNLGGTAVGTSSSAQTVQLSNTGNSNLDFTHVGFSSGNTSDFVIDANTTSCNFTVALAAGRSCKIGFIFKPSATGARSAVLSITDDTIAGVNTIQLSGTGATTATLTPSSLTYSSTTVGSSSAAQTATLTNTGKAALAISSIAISGSGASSFTETTKCGSTLASGASCTISVVFKPTASGTKSATLTVSDNALGGQQSVALTGAGVSSAAKPALTPASLSFPSQAIGSTSAAQTIKLSNTGTAAMTVGAPALTGPSASNYLLTNGCGTSIAAGGSCTLSVKFKPLAAGTRTATVSVATSAGTVTTPLTGTAVAASAKVSLVSGTNPARLGDVLLTARVSDVSSGTVQIWEGRHLWAQAVSDGEEVKFRVAGMPEGTHLLRAVYVDDRGTRRGSSEMLQQDVLPIARMGPVIAHLQPDSKKL